MADHIHKQIRDRFAVTLGSLATTGTNVFPQHVYAVPEDRDLPALALFMLEEEIELSSIGNTPIYERRAEFAVEGMAQSVDKAPSDTLAQIAKEVEIAMAGDPTLNGLVRNLELEKVEYFYTSEGAQPAGSIRLTYGFEYRTSASDPTVSV